MFYPRLVLFLTEASSAVEEVLPDVLPEGVEKFDFWQYLKDIFTPELIATIISMIGVLSSIFALIKNARSLAKQNSGTINDVINAVTKSIQDGNTANGEKLIAPLLAKINKVEHTEEIFTKVLALLIQNDEKARLAIFDLLQSLGAEDNTVAAAKEEVLKQQEEQKAKDEETIAKLEAMEQAKAAEEKAKEDSVVGRV